MDLRVNRQSTDLPVVGPEPPLIVEDIRYTIKPTTSREKLVECIEKLAQDIRLALDLDFEQRRRYCRRLKLENNRTDGSGREAFLVKLPYDAPCWNSFDHETIELHILQAIQDNVRDQGHVWFGVRAKIDDYMDPLVNLFMEALDEHDDISKISFEEIEAAYRSQLAGYNSKQPLEHNTRDTSASTSVGSASDSNTQSGTKNPELINLCDDEDCVIIDG